MITLAKVPNHGISRSRSSWTHYRRHIRSLQSMMTRVYTLWNSINANSDFVMAIRFIVRAAVGSGVPLDLNNLFVVNDNAWLVDNIGEALHFACWTSSSNWYLFFRTRTIIFSSFVLRRYLRPWSSRIPLSILLIMRAGLIRHLRCNRRRREHHQLFFELLAFVRMKQIHERITSQWLRHRPRLC